MKLKYYRVNANRDIFISVAPNGKVMEACSLHDVELIVNCYAALYVRVFGKFTSISQRVWVNRWNQSVRKSKVVTIDGKYFQSTKKNLVF